MASELNPIDISTIPELARLVDEVRTTGKPRRLQRDAMDVAILSPTRPRRPLKGKTITEADRAAARSAFGAWKDLVDPEALKQQLNELQTDDQPPVQL